MAQAARGPKLGLPQQSMEVAGSGARGAVTGQSDHPVWIQFRLNLSQEGSVSGLIQCNLQWRKSSGTRKVEGSFGEGQWRRWEEPWRSKQ